mgnify:FL=1
MTTAEETKPMITVTNLASEFDMDPRTIRRLIRGLDFRAPRGEDTANRYNWDPQNSDLTKIRATLHKYKNPPPAEEPKHTPVDAPVDERPKAKKTSAKKTSAKKTKMNAKLDKAKAPPEPEPEMDLGEEAEEAGTLV